MTAAHLTGLDPGQGHPAALPVVPPANRPTDGRNSLVGGPHGQNAAPKESSGRGPVPPVSGAAERRPVPHTRRGPGVRGLTDIAGQLSDRDRSVLAVVHDHRFLTTNQIEQFCFTQHASKLSAARTARRVLRRLEDWRLLTRPLRRIGGMTAGSKSSVWMLTNMGRRLRNLEAGRGAVGRVREPGERFVQHYLAIADVRLQLEQAARDGLLELPTVAIEPAAWRSYLGLSGERLTLKPDLFAVTVAIDCGVTAEYEDHWFIEADRGTESIPTLLKQCQQYEAYRRTATEEETHGVFPLVLWVVPDERRADRLVEAIGETSGLDSGLYRVCTPDGLLAAIRGGSS